MAVTTFGVVIASIVGDDIEAAHDIKIWPVVLSTNSLTVSEIVSIVVTPLMKLGRVIAVGTAADIEVVAEMNPGDVVSVGTAPDIVVTQETKLGETVSSTRIEGDDIEVVPRIVLNGTRSISVAAVIVVVAVIDEGSAIANTVGDDIVAVAVI